MSQHTIKYIKCQIKLLHPNSKCLTNLYKNVDMKLDLVCENGHNFKASFHSIKSGSWCPICAGNKKYTIDDVKQIIEMKHPGSICKSDIYINALTKLDIICENNHNVSLKLNSILSGQWCAECSGNKKLTIEYVKEKIESMYPGSKCLFHEYKNNKTMLNLVCENNHNFEMNFNSIQNKRWCPKCSGNKKYTVIEIKSYIERLYPGVVCLFTSYKNNTTKLDLVCENKHSFKISFSKIKTGHWCPVCYGNKKHTIEYIKDYIIKMHPNTICNFDEYKNVMTKLNLTCENGHNFMTNFNDIKNGHWCSECSGNKKFDIEYVKDYINKTHLGAVCESLEYKNINTKLNLICENNHKFKTSFHDIKINRWCPECQEFKSEKYIRSLFKQLTNKTFEKIKPDWLINDKTNCKLELDGYNDELKIAFECQGWQHYEYCKRFHKTEDKFKQQQYRDNLKKELCKKNNIKLICIPAVGVKIDGKIYKEKDIDILIKEFLINECKIQLI